MLIGGVGELARPEKGVLGAYGNVMGDCVSSADWLRPALRDSVLAHLVENRAQRVYDPQ